MKPIHSPTAVYRYMSSSSRARDNSYVVDYAEGRRFVEEKRRLQVPIMAPSFTVCREYTLVGFLEISFQDLYGIGQKS